MIHIKNEKVRLSLQYLWREWLKPLLIISAFVFPFKSAIADWNWVPTGSMKPTILEGDLVFVNKLAYDLKVPFTLWRVAKWGDPGRNDIIVFFSPKDGTRLVKRVIAAPGDTVQMRNNILYLNGQRLEYDLAGKNPFDGEIYEDSHPILAHEKSDGQSHWVMGLPSIRAIRTFEPIRIPEGKYFVMGDSRDNSFDSRYFGFVDRKQIVGRTSRVILSFDKLHSYVPRWKRCFSGLTG
ncbi:MAG TPA: signal peptidase I [Verrucomicrobiae bacterium]